MGKLNGGTYVFVGLERMEGIMVYKVEDVNNPEFVSYINDRDYDAAKLQEKGDLAPEGIKSWVEGETGYFAVSNEVSGTVSVYKMTNSDVTTDLNETLGNAFISMPNPSAGQVNMMFAAENATYTIANLNGTVVESGRTSKAFALADLSKYGYGVYVVTTTVNGKLFTQKIIVE